MSLRRWFKEEWVDVKTGKPCGRKKERSEEDTLLADLLKELVVRLQRLQKK